MPRGFALLLMASLVIASPISLALAQTQLVKNGAFERDADEDGFPERWRGHNLGPEDKLEIDPDPFNHQVFAMVGESGVNKALRQVIKKQLPHAGDLVSFEAMSRAEGATKAGGLYAFRIDFEFDDDTSFAVHKLFSSETEGWSRRSGSFLLPKDLKRVVVSITFNNQTGKAWFDRVSVWDESSGYVEGWSISSSLGRPESHVDQEHGQWLHTREIKATTRPGG